MSPLPESEQPTLPPPTASTADTTAAAPATAATGLDEATLIRRFRKLQEVEVQLAKQEQLLTFREQGMLEKERVLKALAKQVFKKQQQLQQQQQQGGGSGAEAKKPLVQRRGTAPVRGASICMCACAGRRS